MGPGHTAAHQAHPDEYLRKVRPAIVEMAQELLDQAHENNLIRPSLDPNTNTNTSSWVIDFPSSAWTRWWIRQLDCLPNTTLADLDIDAFVGLTSHTAPPDHREVDSLLNLTHPEAEYILAHRLVDTAGITPRGPEGLIWSRSVRAPAPAEAVPPEDDERFGSLEVNLCTALSQAAQADAQFRTMLVRVQGGVPLFEEQQQQRGGGAGRRGGMANRRNHHQPAVDGGGDRKVLGVLLDEYGRAMDAASVTMRNVFVALSDGCDAAFPPRAR